jgi:hypothetical protein
VGSRKESEPANEEAGVVVHGIRGCSGLPATRRSLDGRRYGTGYGGFHHEVIRHGISAGGALAAGHTVTHHAAHEAGAPTVEEALEEVRLLAVHPSRRSRQEVRILEAYVLFVGVAAGEIAALLEGFLAQLPAKLHALLRLQSGEGLACQVLIIFFRGPRSYFAVSVDGFCFGDVVVRVPRS